ncbi:hypothetical protein GGR56DRAFT_674338 [Xylariaceae sp. FL0804]|nr:hypothetical protein GGR56DRAFT_674338 [Xylariaceae sp. FL0804]
MASNDNKAGSAQDGSSRRLAPVATPNNNNNASGRRAGADAAASAARLSASARRHHRPQVSTPHGRAALRAMDQRRAALFTPGKARRRSLREQRETPRDLLRNLSRVLAPGTRRPAALSSSPPDNDNDGDGPPSDDARRRESGADPTLTFGGGAFDLDDDDDDFPIERPRLSLPLGPEHDDDDDDDVDLKPPRSSGLEDLENYTMQSIELPRRAMGEYYDANARDRASLLGSARVSDFYGGGPDLHSDDAGIDSGFFPPPPALDDDDSDDVVLDEGAVLERLDAEDGRRQTVGRESDFGPIQIPDLGNESTFVMGSVASPTREPAALDDIEEENAPMDDYDLGGGGGYDDDNDDDDDGHINEPFGVPDLDSDREEEEEEPNNDATAIVSPTAEQLTTALGSAGAGAGARGRTTKTRGNKKKISRHGVEYPSLPRGVVKRLATTFAKTAGAGGGRAGAKIAPDTLDAVMQATDWFFEQLGDDLGAYARHAGRKTIDESDVVTLMRRQRQTGASTTPFALAQRYLPRELLQEIRMPVPVPSKPPRKKARRGGGGGDGEEEVT